VRLETIEVDRSVQLPRRATDVWAHVTTPEGINDELRPWMHMTTPPGLPGSLEDVVAGAQLGRSYILLLGVVPFDWDDLGIEELEPGYFHERSTMASADEWQHERWVQPLVGDPRGCVVHDRIRFVPRRWVTKVPGGPRFHRAVINALFRHRHQRLAQWAATGDGQNGGSDA
jgi:hypothetical protein